MVLSGPDGEFELGGLDVGVYDVAARHERSAPARAGDVPAGTREVLLKLTLGGRVRGTARFEHTATLLQNGKALIAGGADSSSLASAELYK